MLPFSCLRRRFRSRILRCGCHATTTTRVSSAWRGVDEHLAAHVYFPWRGLAATAVPALLRTCVAVNANGPACAKEAGRFDARRNQALSALPENSGLRETLSLRSEPCLGFPFAPERAGTVKHTAIRGAFPHGSSRPRYTRSLDRNATGKSELRTSGRSSRSGI